MVPLCRRVVAPDKGTQVSELKPSWHEPRAWKLHFTVLPKKFCLLGHWVCVLLASGKFSAPSSYSILGSSPPSMPEHLAPFSGTSQGWALLCPRRHLPERTRNSASSWEQGGEWAGWGGLGMTKGTRCLLWSLTPAAFLLSDECWSLKSRGQGYLGKCFPYSMVKLLA